MALPALLTNESSFVNLRRPRGLYIDKSRLMHSMLEEGKFLFLARPRRFGKTLLVTTLEAYFQGDQQPTRNFGGHALGMARVDDETLLGGTVLEGHKPSQKLRPVIRLDLFDTHADTPAGLERKLLDLLAHVYQNWYLRGVNVGLDGEALTQPEVFPAGSNTSGPGSRLTFLIKVLFLHYGVEPVVLIDEYDAPIVWLIGRDIDRAPFLEVMRSFFGVFKASEDLLHKVFVTGISRFAHVNLFSALNNLIDLSWDPVYAEICGFTEKEIVACMRPYVTAGAKNLTDAGLAMTTDTLLQALRDHYNGYRFSTWPQSPTIYNPYSLLRCLHSLQHPARAWEIAQRGFANYWMSSGSSKMLVDLARAKPYDVPRAIPPLKESDSLAYDLDNISYPALMLQTGYYTLSPETATGIDYPNAEVRDTYIGQLVHSHVEYQGPDKVQAIGRLLHKEKYATFCDVLMDFLADFPGEKMTNETHFHVMLHTLLRQAGVPAVSERHVLGGRPDIILEFGTHACVMEIKYSESTEAALQQIHQRDYGRHLKNRYLYVRGLGLNVTTEDTPRIEHEVVPLYGNPHDGVESIR